MKSIMNVIKINPLLRLATLVLVFLSIDIFPMRMPEMGKKLAQRWPGISQGEEAVNKKRELLIFLDEQEQYDFGLTTSCLLSALYQEVCPIIVSTSLLYSLQRHQQKDSRSIDVLLEELWQIKWAPNRTLKKTRSFSNIVLSHICFKEERWIIKKVNNSLNLLIPLKYVESFNIDATNVKEFNDTTGKDTLSDIELLLGLKVNHMETVDFKSIHVSAYLNYWNYYSVESVKYFVDYLDIIFCKKSDYMNTKKNIPEWYILINGHGGINTTISYLSLDDFKKFLNFLEMKTLTQLLVISSCYAAGVNTSKIYGELKLGTQQYYSFPIIIQGLNDVPFKDTPLEVDLPFWRDNKQIHLLGMDNYVDFFTKAKSLEGNYDEIMKPLVVEANYATNIPQIKLPNIEWFSVLELNKKIVSIGSVLAKTRNPQEPLDLVTKRPGIILLYTDSIPFELRIDFSEFSGIFPMVLSGPIKDEPEFIIYRIKKISSSSTEYLQTILRSFKMSGPKWFFVDEINNNGDIYKDILMFGVEGDLEGLMGEAPVKYYFKDKDNSLFMGSSKKFEFEECGSWDKRDYESKIAVVRKYLDLKEKEEITSEQIKAMENVLIRQLEKQKEVERNVSEPSVD